MEKKLNDDEISFLTEIVKDYLDHKKFELKMETNQKKHYEECLLGDFKETNESNKYSTGDIENIKDIINECEENINKLSEKVDKCQKLYNKIIR